jgi:hypothetical protein
MCYLFTFCVKFHMQLFICPVYLYGEAAALDYRKTVPQIRAGEYEGLSEKVQDVCLVHLISIIFVCFEVNCNSEFLNDMPLDEKIVD